RTICVYSLIETISTGSDSTSATWYGLGADSASIPKPSAAACRTSDADRLFFMSGTVLLLQGDQSEIAEAGSRDAGHHPHDGAVIGGAVAAHIDALVIAGRADGLELGHHLVQRHLRLL